MAESTYHRILDTGKWLTTLLAPDLTAWELKDLARAGIALLKIDYQIKDNDPTFLILEQLENDAPHQPLFQTIDQVLPERINQADALQRQIVAHEQDFENQLKRIIRKNRQAQKDLEFVLNQFGAILSPLLQQEYAQRPAGMPEEQLAADLLYRNAYDIIYYRQVALKNLTLFSQRPTVPWEYLVHHRVIEQTTCQYFPKIIEAYGELAERIITIKPVESPIKSPVKKDNRSLAGTHRVKKIFTFTAPMAEMTLPWGTTIARIFFDFLFAGGRDYYGFCERCEKFFVIQRKGRKKYCSDSCRALAAKDRAQA